MVACLTRILSTTHMMFELDDDINEEQFATEVSGAFLITKEDILREMGVRRSAITKDFSPASVSLYAITGISTWIKIVFTVERYFVCLYFA